MSKKKLARAIGICIAAIIIVAAITVFPSCQSSPRPPTYGLEFDGVNDYMEVGGNTNTTALAVQTTGTWALWFYSKENKNASLISQRYDKPFHGRGIAVNNQTQIVFWSRDANGVWKNAVISYSLNAWNYAVLVQDGNILTGYLNGALVGTGNMGSNLGGRYYSYHKIGDYTDSVFPFNGIIGEVRIYNRALSADEIDGLYKGHDVSDGLLSYWKLDEGSGTIAHDSSGNNNNAALMGNPVWFAEGG
jgi:hypothetical protein